MAKNSLPKPFLKWAGGKGNLVIEYEKLGLIPDEFNNYFEPFLGGGAMYFYLWRRKKIKNKAFLSDINSELINVYEIIKENVDKLLNELKKLKNKYSKDDYYRFRDEYNALKKIKNPTPGERIRKAALLIYLNKTCYNGLYRENRKGEFNVPFGRYKNPSIYDRDNLLAVSKALHSTILKICDFEECLKNTQRNDFVYFDPPYMPLSLTASFTSYHKLDFSYEDQKRLARVFKELTEKGVKVLLSNAYHPDIEKLYRDIEGAVLTVVQAPRFINSKAESRGAINEYAITNYPPTKHGKQLTLI